LQAVVQVALTMVAVEQVVIGHLLLALLLVGGLLLKHHFLYLLAHTP
jgi:hypothetical protein